MSQYSLFNKKACSLYELWREHSYFYCAQHCLILEVKGGEPLAVLVHGIEVITPSTPSSGVYCRPKEFEL